MSRVPSWYLNGVSLASLGFMPEPTEPGRRSPLALSRGGVQLPGLAGQLPDGLLPSAPARTVVVAGEVKAADRDAVLAAVRTILAHASRGPIELRCVDALDRVITVERDGMTSFSVDAPSMLAAQRSGRLELRFVAHDPSWRDRDPIDLVIGQLATPCPLGESMPSPWTLEIFGSVDGDVTNPQVILADAEGTDRASFTLTGALTSWATDPTSMWEVSTEGLVTRIRQRNGGFWTDDEAALTAGGVFALSPRDGWIPGGLYPTVRLFDAAGRASGRLRYYRRYEL